MKHLSLWIALSCLALAGCGSGAYTTLIEDTGGRLKSQNGTLSGGGGSASGTTDTSTQDASRGDGNQGANLRIPEGGMQSGLGQVVEAGNRGRILGNCKSIAQSIFAYETSRGSLPPTAITDRDGTPLLSWRVALLQDAKPSLYRKFNTKEPWDSPQNIALLEEMPEFYDMGYRLDPGNTVVMAVVGPETVFEGGDKKVRLTSVRDGTDATGLFVVASHAAAVPWTKPQELNFSDDLGSLVADSRGQCFIAFLDSNIKRVSDVTTESLRASFSKSMGD
ncbi:MAG: hypothetical protein AAF497_05475 [Planctomycetota bacterium]